MIHSLQMTVLAASDHVVIDMLNLSMEPDRVCCSFWIIADRAEAGANIIIMGQVYNEKDN